MQLGALERIGARLVGDGFELRVDLLYGRVAELLLALGNLAIAPKTSHVRGACRACPIRL